MKFVVVYPNNPKDRDAIFSNLVAWSKRVDLENKGINAHRFKILKDWPPIEVSNTLPLELQVEEVELIDDKLRTIRKLVNDAELITEQPKEIENAA